MAIITILVKSNNAVQATVTRGQVKMTKRANIVLIHMPPSPLDASDKEEATQSPQC